MILADENIDAHLVSMLRGKNIEVTHIKEVHPGISDREVIDLSKTPTRIILTEDKDFGEWVDAHNDRNISVILLRYNAKDIDRITSI